MSKPNVLVLGGVGFVGRNVVKYLVDNQLADKIRIADKVLPATAFLGAEHQAAFNAPNVEYKQSNLTNAGSIAKAFELEGGAKFNIVFNLAAETKFGQTKEVYKEKIVDLSVKCATEAAKQGVDRFIEVSTAQVYKPGKKPLTEKSDVDPMNLLAEHKYAAEQELRKIPGLNLIIVRPAIIYGPGDTQGLSPRLIIGAVYKYLDEKMKLLWDEDTRLNTVHVRDVCKAIWHLSQRGQLGAVYNLADKSDTDQGKMNKLIEAIYGIKTGFQGTVVNLAAKAAFETVSEQVNDKHLKPWAEMCKKSNIQTPLTPYLDSEMLTEKSLNVDGSAIEATGFTYDHPQITEQLLRESIDYWARQNLFPSA